MGASIDADIEALRDALSARLAAAGRTEADVCVAAGLCRSALWSSARKGCLPNLRTILRICEVLGIRPSDLLRDAGM